MAIIRLAAMVLLAACAERGPGGLSEEQFWQQNAGYEVCDRDGDCEIALEPCDACPIAVNAWSAPQFRLQAMAVVCAGDGAGDCESAEYAACVEGQCALLAGKPPPQVCGGPVPPGVIRCGCNAVANTGCNAGEKCSFVAAGFDPLWGCTTCLPDGARVEGQACTSPTSVDSGDDCIGGLLCVDGYCTEVCDTLDNTTAIGTKRA